MPFIAIALVLAAALGGGTSVAAQRALPDEPLWQFKVQVNERIGAALAPSGAAQAAFDLLAIEARIKETSQLVAQGRLTTSVQATIESNINAHIARVKAEVQNLKNAGEFNAAGDAEARLEAILATKAIAGVLQQ